MNGVWSFIKDGKPTGARFVGPEKSLAANTPDGCEAVKGIVEIETKVDPELERSRIISSIQQLEQKQVRAIAELLENPNDELARSYFDTRKAEIAKLRSSLAGMDTSAP